MRIPRIKKQKITGADGKLLALANQQALSLFNKTDDIILMKNDSGTFA
jgi:hypothetical protein